MAQCIVGGATPGPVVLGSLKKQVEQARKSKSVSSTCPWLLHQLVTEVSALYEFLSFTDLDFRLRPEKLQALGLLTPVA